MSELPSSAKTVIVGGGIIGCSTAYHLAHRGEEVVVLEKAKLTSGSTWHAAGLVGQLRSNANVTQLLGYSVDLYQRLEAETGLATGWKMNGGLRLACTEERWTEVKRQATTARSFGLDMQLLTAKEAQDLWPLMQVDDVVGAAFLPTDGQASPSDIAAALAKGARMQGAEIFEDTPVARIIVDDGALVGVETPGGVIACERLVLCCGQWTRALAPTIGVSVPLISVQHQYMITEGFGVPGDLPTLRDPDRLTYYKEEVGGLVMGGYEPNPIPWAVDGLPENFDFQLLDVTRGDGYGDLFGQQVVPSVAGLDLDHIPSIAQTRHMFSQQNFHCDPPTKIARRARVPESTREAPSGQQKKQIPFIFQEERTDPPITSS